MLGTLIGLGSGAIGGNVAGAVLKNMSMGPIGNSLAGIVGGAGAASLLGGVFGDPTAGAGTDVGSIVGALGSGLVGGGGLMAIIGVVRNMIGR